MAARILDGKAVAAEIREGLKRKVAAMKRKPGLAAILIGENPASKVYVGIKRRTCDEVGIHSELHELHEATAEEELLRLIQKLNSDKKIDAILLQLPLPAHISEERALAEIALEKDVDGFHAMNLGKLMRGEESIVACTPRGIIRLLDHYGIAMGGKHAVVVGRSTTVGRPVALMLLNRNATVTMCHSRTRNLERYTKEADILVAAAGRPGLITAAMVKEGAVVVDVGINRVDGAIVGDVDFDAVKEKASYITPVPGGIGPMTVVSLLENTVRLSET